MKRQIKAEKKPTLMQLRAEVKAKFPKIKGLTDATRGELQQVLDENDGNSQLVMTLQERWQARSKSRHEQWLKGDSKSAKAARTKGQVTA